MTDAGGSDSFDPGDAPPEFVSTTDIDDDDFSPMGEPLSAGEIPLEMKARAFALHIRGGGSRDGIPSPADFQRRSEAIKRMLADWPRHCRMADRYRSVLSFLAPDASGHIWTNVDLPDISAIRALAAEYLDLRLRGVGDGLMEPEALNLPHHLGIVLGMQQAPAFYLGGPTATALLASEPPGAEIMERVRLPFREVLVYFPAFRAEVETAVMGEVITSTSESVCAVLLSSDVDGRIDPCWCALSAANMDGKIGTALYFGLWTRSQFAAMVANIAALLTWGSWTEPYPVPPLPPEDDHKSWKHAMKSSQVRKAIKHGAFDGVRVLDVGSVTHRSGPNQGGTHASPITHMRRAHWRWVRLGTGSGSVNGSDAVEGETYVRKPRWVPPTLVNPDGPTRSGARAYRVTERSQ